MGGVFRRRGLPGLEFAFSSDRALLADISIGLEG